MALSGVDTLSSAFLEIFSVMQSEMCIFALAALIYLAMWTGRIGRLGSTKKVKSPPPSPKSKPTCVGKAGAATQKPSVAQATQSLAGTSDHPILKLLRSDSPTEALRFLNANHKPLPESVAQAVLKSCASNENSELALLTFTNANATTKTKLCPGLIRVYLARGEFEKAICLYEEVLVPARVQMDTPLCEQLLQAATQIGRTSALNSLAESIPGNAAKCAKQIREHGKDGNLEAAVAVFNKLKGLDPNMKSVYYNSILDACVQNGDMSSAFKYFQEAKDAKLVDVVSCNIVVKGHLAANNTKGVRSTLNEMKQLGLTASHATYHSLLQSCVQAGDHRGAWQYSVEMRESGLKPTPVTCSMLFKLVSSPAQAGFLKRILSLSEQMDNAADEVFLVALVDACLKSQCLDVLADRLRDYRRNEFMHQLSPQTYGAMIKAYGQARDAKQVRSLWSEMQRCKVQPSTITLGCMVDALVMNGEEMDAWELVREMWDDEERRHLVNTVIYSTIVKGFAMSRKLDKALAVYDEMRARGVQCNTITYNTMLNALVRCGDLCRLPQLLEDMNNSTPKVEPDMITYSTIVKGYCSAGDLDKGLALLRNMEETGHFTPDEVMFNSLLDGCAKERRFEDALALLEKMRTAGVAPSNYTLSIMVKLLSRSRRLSRAFAMVKDVTAEFGFRPNIQVYTCLIQACFHNKELGKALALHDQIIEEGCHFDSKAYMSLVRGCVQAGKLEHAADVIRCAFGLPGSRLRQASGQAPGVEKACVDEVLAKLRSSGSSSAMTAQKLASDLAAKQKGGRVTAARPTPEAARQVKSTTESLPWRKAAALHQGKTNKDAEVDSSRACVKAQFGGAAVPPWRKRSGSIDDGERSTDCSSGPSDESSVGENSDVEIVQAK